MYIDLHVEFPLLSSEFNETWIISTDFGRKLKNKISGNSIQWEPNCSTRTGRHTTKL